MASAATSIPSPRTIAPGGYGAALPEAIKSFDRLPALEDSKARVLAALSWEHPSIGEAMAVIETDPGLTAAALRAANTDLPRGRKRIASVPAAVESLGSGALHTLVSGWPTFRPLGRDVLPLHRLSSHANATRLAADAVARALDFESRHQLRAVALLHDVGKLVLVRAWSDYPRRLDAGMASPEERLRLERRLLGLDHAAVGGLVLERWGLPKGLATFVARHHADDAQAPASLIRLADMLAHHSHGHPVGEEALRRAASAVGLDPASLRTILFELPRAPGGRLADPSPLTPMQAKVLRLLGQAKKYKAIAAELGLAESTVRSHAHTTYATLGVTDRAQAVLLATGRGWI